LSKPRHIPREIDRGGFVRIGIVARPDDAAGQRALMEALAAIAHTYPYCRFELAADDAHAQPMLGLARDLGISQLVALEVAPASEATLAEGWDLFVYVGTRTEGFATAMAGAMALGLPCVVSDLGSAREVGGEMGAVRYVVERSAGELAANAMALLRDRSRRSLMSNRARERARAEFAGSQFAEKIRMCLQE
jgi:glycosyltransferase involved in cell wall biosynthesis